MRKLLFAGAALCLVISSAGAQTTGGGGPGTGGGGGGGGAMTLAAGAVAPGAYSVGAGLDGWNVTQGTKSDSAATSGTGGSWTIASLLRGILNAIKSAIPDCGAISACSNIGGTFNAANTYKTVAASQSAQVLGATGAIGDYLSHCTAVPATTSPGVVTILDNSTAIYSFPGGASSVSNLVPFTIPIGALSVSGAWKVTTGANVSVVCVGKFT